ncbi:hypothetical protein GW17_00032627 [Ensete ventricosum]|nr:hypothetical protein GW17_00032627 [Ensete ventricosum]RZS01508.1 hypothetical protein BHM03_00031380 [Ensete ventricosum]
MMTDSGFSPPVANPTPSVIIAEAFLDLTNQVQALTGMVQTIVPYLSQLIQSIIPQSAPLTTPLGWSLLRSQIRKISSRERRHNVGLLKFIRIPQLLYPFSHGATLVIRLKRVPTLTPSLMIPLSHQGNKFVKSISD